VEDAMIINDLCRQYAGVEWVDRAMAGFLDDLAEHGRSKAPKKLYSEGLFEQIDWLVHRCDPPYSLMDIDDYLIDCQTP
jgi:hypothetical protein